MVGAGAGVLTAGVGSGVGVGLTVGCGFFVVSGVAAGAWVASGPWFTPGWVFDPPPWVPFGGGVLDPIFRRVASLRSTARSMLRSIAAWGQVSIKGEPQQIEQGRVGARLAERLVRDLAVGRDCCGDGALIAVPRGCLDLADA